MKYNKKLNNIEEGSLKNASTKKKISFFTSILVVIGSCIGSGIFFKSGSVLSSVQGSIVMAIFCWLFASFGVICMALALVEITSVRNDNLSIIGWTKTFNSRIVYKSCKNFITFIFAPLKYFFLPLYCIQAFQDGVAALYINSGHPYNGFGTNADWAIIMAISIGISVYFIVANGISARMGGIHSYIISFVKFIPLSIAAVVGFLIFAMNNGNIVGNYDVGFIPNNTILAEHTFKTLTPGFGLFIGCIGIFYAYDGFYTAAGIKSELKEPKKIPTIILVGLSITTCIYLIIAVSMSLGSNGGNPQGLVQWFAKHNILPLFSVFEILIGVSVLSVINGMALWSPRFIEDLIKDSEIPFSVKLVTKINGEKRYVGLLYIMSLAIPLNVILSILGGLVYINTVDASGVFFANSTDLSNILGNNFNFSEAFDNDYINGKIIYHYGTGVGGLYTFCDLISNWSALFVFSFIILAIVGGLKNRKTKKVKTNNFKYFKPFAILAILLISSCLIMGILEPIANLFLMFNLNSDEYSGYTNLLISRIMVVILLFIYLSIMLLPTLISDTYKKHKFGSIQKGELYKINQIRNQLNLKPLKTYKNN